VRDGLSYLSIDKVPLIFRRGVLIDVAGSLGMDALPEDFEITPKHLETASRGADIAPGSVILLRTGWARYYGDAARYISEVRGPGPAIEGVRWLSERQPFAVGSDTVGFEKVPSPSMAGHVHLLFEKGIHIIEVLNLEALARDRVYEFVFVGAPLKIQGGTGAPIRPFALA
jgi:kynurenine formamidase